MSYSSWSTKLLTPSIGRSSTKVLRKDGTLTQETRENILDLETLPSSISSIFLESSAYPIATLDGNYFIVDLYRGPLWFTNPVSGPAISGYFPSDMGTYGSYLTYNP